MSKNEEKTSSPVVDALALSLADASAAGVALLVKRYGAGADRAAVTLALATARVLAGAKAPHNGTGTKVRTVAKAVAVHVDSNGADSVTDALLVTLSRVVLDAAKAESKAARDVLAAERQAAKDVANDRGASMTARQTAFGTMAAIDSAAASVKSESAHARIVSAIVSAKDAGVDIRTILADVALAFGAVVEYFPASDAPVGLYVDNMPAEVAA